MTRSHRTLPPTRPGATWALVTALAIFVGMVAWAFAIGQGWVG